MDFLPEDINNYVKKHTQAEPAHLKELNHETWEKVLNPRMLSGHLQGRVLSMLSHMIKPKNILEIGTYTGYSTLCFAEGLLPEGHIDTIDINEELALYVEKYLNKVGIIKQVTLHNGNALDIIPTLNKQYDIVFIDADKANYINYYNLAFDKVRQGGYIIADNVLWNGKILQTIDKNDIDTSTIIEYNTLIQNDKRVENVLFPIRDGLMIARKL